MSKIVRFERTAKMKVENILESTKRVLKSQSGEGFVDTAVKILISVVIGGLLLAGLYLLFKDNILFSSRYKHDKDCYA